MEQLDRMDQGQGAGVARNRSDAAGMFIGMIIASVATMLAALLCVYALHEFRPALRSLPRELSTFVELGAVAICFVVFPLVSLACLVAACRAVGWLAAW